MIYLWIGTAVAVAAAVAWIIWGNTALEVNTHIIRSDRVPEGFDGYRIAQISDLHNAEIGRDNGRLLDALREARPDIIVITGDMIDSRHTDTESALALAKAALAIAPCYYVTGNHESRMEVYPAFKEDLMALGVAVLEKERVELSCGEDTLVLLGVDDPCFYPEHEVTAEEILGIWLTDLQRPGDPYTVLLCHRPELFGVYGERGIDLALCGHAHGGQFRLPLIGGLLSPAQGWFPVYDAGVFAEGRSHMIVSRGIGNSLFPFRLNNRPELVLVELRRPEAGALCAMNATCVAGAGRETGGTVSASLALWDR